jgi:nitrite reductase/ring-hydroxylating ferredoxin subunit/uncharacterized membrane protein
MATTVRRESKASEERGGFLGAESQAAREAWVSRIEGAAWLDPLADRLQALGHRVRGLGDRRQRLLSGTWLGHPLHPALTDLVVGAWSSSLVLDAFGGKAGRASADRLVGVGIAAAVPTALAGLSDAADLAGGPRRAATVHALGNSTALALYGMSWLARRRDRRITGRALGALGFGVAGGSAWLGGHLSFVRGVGVNQTAFERLPADWTRACDVDDLKEDVPERVTANGAEIVLVRRDEHVFALSDRCSHRGCSLSEGRIEDGAIVCPCHGSTFRLDGTVVTGPATAPQPVVETRIREGRVEVRAAHDDGVGDG